jgi:hypothetical protein
VTAAAEINVRMRVIGLLGFGYGVTIRAPGPVRICG